MKIFLLIILVSILIIIYIVYFKYFRKLRSKEDGFKFVYVDNNGKVRELDNEEMEYLKEEFHPNDGGRPYIKTSYNDLTPDGKMSGFIHRNRVPKNINIEKEKANA